MNVWMRRRGAAPIALGAIKLEAVAVAAERESAAHAAQQLPFVVERGGVPESKGETEIVEHVHERRLAGTDEVAGHRASTEQTIDMVQWSEPPPQLDRGDSGTNHEVRVLSER